jgi:hypothetical protein
MNPEYTDEGYEDIPTDALKYETYHPNEFPAPQIPNFTFDARRVPTVEKVRQPHALGKFTPANSFSRKSRAEPENTHFHDSVTALRRVSQSGDGDHRVPGTFVRSRDESRRVDKRRAPVDMKKIRNSDKEMLKTWGVGKDNVIPTGKTIKFGQTAPRWVMDAFN